MPIYHSRFKQSDTQNTLDQKQIILETAFLRHPKTVYLIYAMAFNIFKNMVRVGGQRNIHSIEFLPHR